MTIRPSAAICASILVVTVVLPVEARELVVVRHPAVESRDDVRQRYPLALLTHLLDLSGELYRLEPVPGKMVQARALKHLERNEVVDVVWSMTSVEREQSVMPIRVPLDKGLLGVRLLLIRAEDQAKFAQVRSLSDLARITMGQGHDWPDCTILESNGIPVVKSASYEGLFHMLVEKRFDCFPRSVQEVADEARVWEEKGIVIEKTLVLYYRAPLYYFVNPGNTALRTMIIKGFTRAVRDGSFDRMFLEYNAKSLALLKNRRLILLNNPCLPPETPLAEDKYWIRLP